MNIYEHILSNPTLSLQNNKITRLWLQLEQSDIPRDMKFK